MGKGKKRRRVSRDDVRDNARKGGGGGNYFNLPSGIRSFSPDKPGKITLDFLPYEVKTDNHPDGREPGDVWYKYPFFVHHSIGVRNDSFVCPTSIGKKCPICEERERLAIKDKEKYKEAIKKLRPQKFVAYNINDPEDKEKIAIFAMSRGKFAVALEKELDEGDDDILNFFDVTDDGRTLKIRFSEETYEGRKFLKATRIDFLERDEMDEDKTFKRTVVLDECFNVLPYDKLKSFFLQIDENDDKDDDDDDDEDKPNESKGKEETKSGDDDDNNDEDEKPSEKGKDSSDSDDKDKNNSSDSKDDDSSDEKEKEVEKPKNNKKSDDDEKCPAKGGVYGKEADKHKECEDCPLWDKCDDLCGG